MYTHSMEAIYLSLSAQVAMGQLFSFDIFKILDIIFGGNMHGINYINVRSKNSPPMFLKLRNIWNILTKRGNKFSCGVP